MKPSLHLFIICLLFCVFRICAQIVPDFPVNSVPITALLLYAVYFCNRKGLLIASTIWFVSYPILSMLQGYPVGGDLWASLLGFAPTIGIAYALRKKGSTWLQTLLGAMGGACAFYFLTNTCSWIVNPLYAKSLEGFTQAQWTGHPSYSLPTWVFLRNSLVANALFASIIGVSQLKAPITAKQSVIIKANS